MTTEKNLQRCAWVTQDPLLIAYHDHEWGVPIKTDHELFVQLNLEGQQAGLSWITILKKRAAYLELFANFDPERLLRFSPQRIKSLLANPSIIRNKLKVQAIISNARAYLAFKQHHAHTSFSEFLWAFAPKKDKPTANNYQLTVSPESIALSNALKKLGFKFVGPTICYAFMQAVGMIAHIHEPACFKISNDIREQHSHFLRYYPRYHS